MKPTMLVTGAASGIGRAIATHFARQGWFVGLADIDREGLDGLSREISEPHLALALDVRDSDAWQMAVAAFAQATNGRLDVFVNNAGIAHSGNFEDIPLGAALEMIDINLAGAVRGIYACLPLLKSTAGAQLINMGSSAGLFGYPDLAVYSATKAAMATLSEVLSIEFAEHGICVTTLQPHFTKTPLLDAPFHTAKPNPPSPARRLSMVRRYDVDLVVEAVEKVIARKSRGAIVGAEARHIYWLKRFLPAVLRRIVRHRWRKASRA
jgi:NAD(P)-dependent dehydrogenase (short-subunit alcohol dehydrogenase family)